MYVACRDEDETPTVEELTIFFSKTLKETTPAGAALKKIGLAVGGEDNREARDVGQNEMEDFCDQVRFSPAAITGASTSVTMDHRDPPPCSFFPFFKQVLYAGKGVRIESYKAAGGRTHTNFQEFLDKTLIPKIKEAIRSVRRTGSKVKRGTVTGESWGALQIFRFPSEGYHLVLS